jgi:LysM repeat protein
VAVLLVIVGIIIVVTSMNGGGLAKLLATKTPTPTITPTETNTPVPTDTMTITPSPTVTSTSTPSGPQNYTVLEGDTLTSIVQSHNLGSNGLILIYLLNPLVKDPTTGVTTGIDPSTAAIQVGQTIVIPNPGMKLPTSTALPTGLVPGSRITYQVLPGDSLAAIANKMNSTVAAIVAANQSIMKTDGANTVLYQGELIIIPIDLVTPVPTKAATATPTATP